MRKFKKQVDFFEIYVCSTHCEVGYKVGQHDIWAWTPNNLKISSVTLGHKILKFPQKKVVSQSLSFHIIFSIKVYIGHNLVCIQNEQNTIFDFFATKFGALLILQECPSCSWLSASKKRLQGGQQNALAHNLLAPTGVPYVTIRYNAPP